MNGDESLVVSAVLGLTLVLGGVFVLARVITRTLIKPRFGLDDVLIIITWFILLGFSTAYFVAISHGYGKHASELPLPELLQAGRAAVIGEVLVIWAYPTGKAAVAYLLSRLFPGRTLKWVLWSFVAANAFFFYISGILLLVQCHPVAFQWDKSIKDGTCWSPEIAEYWGYAAGAVGAVTDLTFAIIPWFYIANLQMAVKKKIAIGVALSAGLIPFVCSVLKVYYVSNLGYDTDPTYDTIPLLLSGACETCAINIAACIPTLNPLYLWLSGRDPKSLSFARSMSNSEHSRYGTHLKLFGVFSRKRYGDNELSSLDGQNQIVQHKTYDVHVEGGGNSSFKAESSTVVLTGAMGNY